MKQTIAHYMIIHILLYVFPRHFLCEGHISEQFDLLDAVTKKKKKKKEEEEEEKEKRGKEGRERREGKEERMGGMEGAVLAHSLRVRPMTVRVQGSYHTASTAFFFYSERTATVRWCGPHWVSLSQLT